MILILTNKWDLTTDFVVRKLRQRGHEFLRLNTEALASEVATITLPDFHILVSKQGELYDLTDDVGVIWNRRPGKPFDDVPSEDRPSAATQRYVNDQWYSWLEALQLLQDVTWINHPYANSLMESKIRQLRLASKLGFSVPETIISNDPVAARRQLRKWGGNMIAKALYSPLIEEPEQDFFIFTNELDQIDSSDDEAIKVSPSIFQKPIAPKMDYRVTVVGEDVFPVKIESADGLPVNLDWRTQKENLQFRLCRLPTKIEELCRHYVEQCGLLFGAIDLIEHQNEFFFLEINPNGEWGWLQEPTGVPIAESLCDLMIRHDTAKQS